MYITIKIYFLLFLIYAFIGWIMEILVTLKDTKKLVNRGFLIGPYCPIYGCGGILITLLLNRFIENPILLFFMAILVCGILEYLTSFFMEKIFHFRWWDYSNKKININGRVCLDTIIPFGLLGVLITYVTNPFFLNHILYNLSETQLNVAFYVLACIFVIDNIISFITILGIRNTGLKVNKENRADNTEEITKKVRKILLGKSFIQRRLLTAYPKLEVIKTKVKEKIDQTKEDIEKRKRLLNIKVYKARHEFKRKIEHIDLKIIKKKKE